MNADNMSGSRRANIGELQKQIVCVKDGIVANVVTISFTFFLCALIIWLIWRADNPVAKIAAPFFCFFWLLFGVYGSFQNIRNPKSCLLVIRNDQLVWILRKKESGPTEEQGIPLQKIDTLEFVLPETGMNVGRPNALAELFILDVHGNRHHLPIELWPGVNREKIVDAIQRQNPTIKVVERVGNQ